MRFSFFAGIAWTALLLSGALHADTVLLADGTDYEGKVVRETASEVTFAIRMGSLRGSVVIPKTEIISLKYGAVAPDTVATDGVQLRKLAEAETEPARAAQAWLRIGEYYDRHPGFWAHARASYEKVLFFDPDQAVARTRLGFVKNENGGWRIPAPARKETIAKNETVAASTNVLADQAQVPAQAAISISTPAPTPTPVSAPAPVPDTVTAAALKPAAAAPVAPVAGRQDDELAIGLRKDAATIKQLLAEGARRVALQRAMLQRERAARNYDNDWGNGEYFLLSNGLYYYPGGSAVYLTSNGVYGYPYGGYSYGNGYGNACYNSCGGGYGYGSGLNAGISGRIGNVHIQGGINTGGSRHGGSSFRGGGFRF